MKITGGNKNYWAILCYCSDEPLICGVYCSAKEAREAEKDIKGCPAKHCIKKCKVEIKIIKNI